INHFLQTDVDEKYKRFVENVEIVPYINNRYKNFYGFLSIVENTDKNKKLYHVEDDIKTIKFENERCWIILEICPKKIFNGDKNPQTELRDTVAHELAHLIEMRIYGFKNRHVRFHGPKWQYFAKKFGCFDIIYND
ncbi:MAG: SprT-like domain-containing protein, partial [Atribacterota bacterium]